MERAGVKADGRGLSRAPWSGFVAWDFVDALASGMQCNIDARGKAVRLLTGLVSLVLAAALALVILAGWVPGGWLWLAVAGAAIGGVFAVFEGWAGWCVVRALGFRTPV